MRFIALHARSSRAAVLVLAAALAAGCAHGEVTASSSGPGGSGGGQTGTGGSGAGGGDPSTGGNGGGGAATGGTGGGGTSTGGTTSTDPDMALQVTILAPAEGTIVHGGLTTGFDVAPSATVSGGTGKITIWAQVGNTKVDLGAADGTVSFSLPVGVDFPHAPVLLEVHAKDEVGQEGVASTHVVPDIVISRFDAPVGAGKVAQLDSLGGGALAVSVASQIGLAGGLFIVPEPGVPAAASLSQIPSYSAYALAGDGLIAHADLGPVGEIQRILPPASAASIESYVPQQGPYPPAPAVLASGDVLVQWADVPAPPAVYSSHLRLFAPDGAAVWAQDQAGITPPGELPGSGYVSGTVEASPGQLFALIGTDPSGSSDRHWVAPVDLGTGALGAFWPSPARWLTLVADAQGMISSRYEASSPGNPPDEVWLSQVSPSGLDWEYNLGNLNNPWPLIGRQADGSARALVISPNGKGSRWVEMGPGGIAEIWNSGQEVVLGGERVPGGDDLLIRTFGQAPTRLLRLSADGSVAWSVPLDPGLEGFLADGTIFGQAGFGYPDEETITVFRMSAEGAFLWSDSVVARGYEIIGEIQGRLFASYSKGGDFVYEARAKETGEVVLRYREPASDYTEPLVRFDPAWGHVVVIDPPGADVVSLIGLSL